MNGCVCVFGVISQIVEMGNASQCGDGVGDCTLT